MKIFRLFSIIFFIASSCSIAWAQYGLYGSPDSLRITQQPAAVPYDNYPAAHAGQTGSAPGVYPQQVAPYAAPSGYVAQQTPYAAPAANSTPDPVYRTAYASRPYSTETADDMPALNEPSMPQNSNLTNLMLSERGQMGTGGSNGYVSPNSSGGACRTGVEQYQAAACGVETGCCYDACPWYVSLSALAMSRNNANNLWAANDPFPNEYNQYPVDAESSWKMGGEIRFGRRFCACGCDPCNSASSGYWALEADYWTLCPFEGTSSVMNPNAPFTLATPFVVSNIEFRAFDGSQQLGTFWFNDASEQRHWRRDEVHSVEINLVRGQWANVCGSNWDFAFSAGPRFFRFRDELQIGALKDGFAWGQDGGAWEAYLSDRITNDLWGGQVGFDLGYNFGGGALRLFATPKVGIYDNNVTTYFQANLGNGNVATLNYPGQLGGYPVSASTNVFAVLSQIDVGAEWFFARRWSARVGYRLVAISGIGLADNQFPTYINDIQAIAAINTNGDLILHGAFASLTFNF